MKKEYKKPELLFESFELSSSIAGTCGYTIDHDESTCCLSDSTFTNTKACAYQPVDGDPEKACYHNFLVGFTS